MKMEMTMTSPALSTPPTSNQRLPFLDWVRVGAFGLLILYHVGMFYVTWDWHVKSRHAGPALEPLMLLSNPWRLSLLFMVSGIATRFMADRMRPGALLRSRLARLGLPLLFVMAVLVVPQPYYEVVEKINYADGFLAFYGRYLTFYQGFCRDGDCLTLPTWNHMWFVAYLLAYTVLLTLALALGGGRMLARLGAAGWTKTPWLLAVGPMAVLVLLRLFLIGSFPVTHNLVWDWYNHAVSFGIFILGYVVARNSDLFERMASLRWHMLGLGLAAWAFYAWYGWTYWQDGSPDPAYALRMASRVAYGVEQWAMIVAVLGFARQYLNQSSALLRYLSRGVFPFYIIHQTLIVVIGHNLTPFNLPVVPESLLIITLTVAGCFATYELARRIGRLGVLLGVG